MKKNHNMGVISTNLSAQLTEALDGLLESAKIDEITSGLVDSLRDFNGKDLRNIADALEGSSNDHLTYHIYSQSSKLTIGAKLLFARSAIIWGDPKPFKVFCRLVAGLLTGEPIAMLLSVLGGLLPKVLFIWNNLLKSHIVVEVARFQWRYDISTNPLIREQGFLARNELEEALGDKELEFTQSILDDAIDELVASDIIRIEADPTNPTDSVRYRLSTRLRK